MKTAGIKKAVRATRSSGSDRDAVFQQHESELSVLLGFFFLRHLLALYRNFKGDLILPIVLGEIAHHNICRHYSSGRRLMKAAKADWTRKASWEALEPCGAFSLSHATGIPRETIRRKIQMLVAKGLIQKHPKGGYVIRMGISQHFTESHRKSFDEVMDFFESIQEIIKSAPASLQAAGSKTKRAQGKA